MSEETQRGEETIMRYLLAYKIAAGVYTPRKNREIHVDSFEEASKIAKSQYETDEVAKKMFGSCLPELIFLTSEEFEGRTFTYADLLEQ